ncbi:esterase [Kitasatospora herbaricolor]|uniref:serine hydrolase domain-containing protein n=1 Tax=Kitasatospora herbaricolor TaxID=68217 RepID=UPI001749DA89|nr:serine hydrolase domain-containing protein [Kitasatospora herbaricolor]MDQ0312300.1 CubicO group peptidase (beta-lactamase class C family) [Kitasatospora herbaricolor]GGV14921.1 esterase [Kitasatospora herbaricolor]
MTSSSGPLVALVTDGLREVGTGAVWAVGDAAGVRHEGRHGPLGRRPGGPGMARDTLFDLASLTKIVALWPCAGALRTAGRLPLDDPLGSYWTEVAGLPVGDLTARRLLTHTAGLPPRTNFARLYGTDPAAVRAGVLAAPLHRPPGLAVEYTDRAAIILGYLVEALGGAPLARLAAEQVWRPLGMTDTAFGPLGPVERARTAPTEFDPATGDYLTGVVHDPSARLLGGVCGSAGAFSTAHDLGLFLTSLLGPGPAAGWVAESLREQTGGLTPARGLSWLCAPGTDPSAGTFVHYGFTGTAMWLNRRQGRWAVLLTNKVHLNRELQPLTDLRNAFRREVFG